MRVPFRPQAVRSWRWSGGFWGSLRVSLNQKNFLFFWLCVNLGGEVHPTGKGWMVPAEKKTQGIAAVGGSQGSRAQVFPTSPFGSAAATAGAGNIVRSAEHGDQEFQDHADINDPQEVSDQSQQQGQQAL